MNRLWGVAQAGLFFLDPETAHEASLRALEAGVYPRAGGSVDPALTQTVFGIAFPNPVGLAAGYDKDARVYNAMFGMGFGFVEAGTVTPQPQPGNPKPRVFRLVRDRAVINRLGFNSAGHEAALARLRANPPQGVLGINIGANKDSADPITDYVRGVEAFAPFASYLTVNISSPNTPGLRDLQAPDRLNALLDRVMAARDKAPRRVPVAVKLAPDIADEDIAPVAACLMAHKVDAAILTNTTLSRGGLGPNAYRGESGGLSGPPLYTRATRFLARFYLATDGRLPLIGAGGIDSGPAALGKVLAGATLLQIYTGLIFEGPQLVQDINAALAGAVRSKGTPLAGLTGLEAERWAAAAIPG
jgi:dihydroorotate dehydrogenase